MIDRSISISNLQSGPHLKCDWIVKPFEFKWRYNITTGSSKTSERTFRSCFLCRLEMSCEARFEIFSTWTRKVTGKAIVVSRGMASRDIVVYIWRCVWIRQKVRREIISDESCGLCLYRVYSYETITYTWVTMPLFEKRMPWSRPRPRTQWVHPIAYTALLIRTMIRAWM